MPTRSLTGKEVLAFSLLALLSISCDRDSTPECERGETVCGGRCVDLANDPSHCGACESECEGGAVCDIGRCAAECDSGTSVCDGLCIDLDTDPEHCGACGIACGADEVCSSGACTSECGGYLENCEDICRDLRSDPLHCGDCTHACATEQVCANGLCATVCAGDYTNCGGACRDLESDADHCGACGTTCAEGEVCNLGSCADACDAALTACDGDCVDTTSDARHCGGCDAACPIGEACTGGVCGDTQNPPMFASTPVTEIDEDEAYAYAVTVSDLDTTDTIMITASTLPSWLTFTDNGDGTASLTGTPAQADVGTHAVLLVATDGMTEVEQSFDVVVTEVDEAPVFTSTPITTGGDDRPYAYDITVTDEEGAAITITATTVPAWLTFTDNGDGTATLEGTPTDAEIGSHDVTLDASDGALTATQSFTIVITDENDLPVFTSDAVTAVDEDALYEYEIAATDSDVGMTLSFSAPGLPTWLTLTDNGDGTASLAGTPLNDHVGTHAIEIIVSDGMAMVSQTFDVVVTNTNDAPTFTSVANEDATEDAAYTYAITASDVDVGDTIEITEGSLPGWLTFTETGDGTATLSGTPANADVGNVAITLTVTDVAGDAGTQMFALVVAPVNDPPEFTSEGVLDATEDAAYEYDITASDEESAPLTILATVRPSWLALTDNGNGTATLAGTPANADVGDHTVTLTVSDGVNPAVSQTFTVTVTNVNDAPTFTSTGITAALQDTAYSYAIVTNDVDVGATLTLTAPVLPSWLTFTSTGPGTGTLTGTPTNAQVGPHAVTLSVTDGTETTTQSFTINVADANDPPTFTSVPVTAATEDSAYTYAITTADVDVGATLSLSATVLPSWLMFTNNGGGAGTLTGTPTNAHVGMHSVTITVTDGLTPVTQTFTITVANTNDAPTFTSVPVTSAQATQLYSYAITTADVDAGDTRTITAASLPGWLTLTDNGNGTATLSGTPQPSDAGTVNITLTVNDGEAAATQPFAITVTTQPPVASSRAYSVIGNTEIVVESALGDLATARGNVFSSSANDLLVGATDPDTDPTTLTASVVAGPTSGSLVLQTDGSFSYAPNAGFVGTDSFTFRLSDGQNNSNVATATLNVANRVWYVNNLTNIDNVGAKNPLGGNGTSIDAFDTLGAFELAASSMGDVIFVSVGDSAYDSGDADGLDLLPGQILVGQAANLIIAGTPLSVGMAALRPVIRGTVGHAVTLANNNGIEGVALETTGATDCLRGVGVTNGLLADVLIRPSMTGTGISLASHSGSFGFSQGSITAQSVGTGRALRVSGATSPTITFTGVNIVGVALGVAVEAGGADITMNGGGVALGTGRPIEVTPSLNGGSLILQMGATVSATAVGGDGISVVAGGLSYELRLGDVSLTGSGGSDDGIVLHDLAPGSIAAFTGTTSLAGFVGDGVELVGSSATANQVNLTFVSLSTQMIAGTDVRVAGGRPTAAINLGASGIQNTTGPAVSVTGTSSASITFTGGPIADSVGPLSITTNTSSTVRFDSSVTLNAAAGTAGVVATNNSGSTIRFGTLAVTTNNAAAFTCTAATTLQIGSGTLTGTGAVGLTLTNITSADVNMASTNITNGAGGGIALSNVGGSVRLGALSVTNTGGVGLSATALGTLRATSGSVLTTMGKAIDLDTLTADLTLARVTSSASPSEGIDLTAVGGTLNFASGPAPNVQVTGAVAHGISIANGNAAITFQNVDVSGSGQNGVRLSGNGGSFTVSSGDVRTSTSQEVLVSAGNANIAFGASITNATGEALTVSNTTGGTRTFSGNVACDGTGISLFGNTGGTLALSGLLDVDTTTSTALELINNSAPITLSGTIDVQTTSGRGLDVTGLASGTLAITGTANVIATTTGVPVSVIGTTIAASNVTFRSISTNGAQNGIVLQATGTSGDFFVTGTGSLGSGGTIQNTTGSGVLLTSVSGVHLAWLDIVGADARGIESTSGTGVDDLDLTSVRILNSGDDVNEGGIYITTNLTGACDITSSTISSSSENNVEIVQSSGSLTLAFTSSTIADNSVALGASGVLIETRGSAVGTVTFAGNTIRDHQTNHVRASALDDSDLTVNISTSSFTAPVNPTIFGVVLSTAQNADITFDVNNNTFAGPATVSNMTNHAPLVVTALAGSTLNANIDGYFRNNGSISNQNFGALLDVRGNASHRIAVTGNNFGSLRTRGVDYISGDTAGDASSGHLTVTSNTCTTVSGADTCLLVTPTMSSVLCTDVRSNSFFTPPSFPTVDMSVTAPAVLRLYSTGTDCGGTCANAAAHLTTRNTLSGAAPVTTGVGLNGTPCSLPSL